MEIEEMRKKLERDKKIREFNPSSSAMLKEVFTVIDKLSEIKEALEKEPEEKEENEYYDEINNVYGAIVELKEVLSGKEMNVNIPLDDFLTNLISKLSVSFSKIEQSIKDIPKVEIPSTISLEERQVSDIIESVDNIKIPEFPIKEIGKMFTSLSEAMPKFNFKFDYDKIDELIKAVKKIKMGNTSISSTGPDTVGLKKSDGSKINPATEDKQDDIIANQTNGTQRTLISFNDDAIIDAFGRMRVSNPETIFDSKNIFNDPDLGTDVENQPLYYDNQQTAGSGTSTLYKPNEASTELHVGNETAGTRVRQTKQRFNYQPGKSLLVFMSFVFGTQAAGITRREGMFDENNGLFLEDDGEAYNLVRRTFVSGTPDDDVIPQSTWNIDKFDGTGASGIELNFTKTQILVIDFEWLGVGRVRYGFVIDGLIYYCHEINNANNLTTVYMSNPNLPLRSEINNDGTGVASTLTQICSTVISEGGRNPLGSIRSASTNGTHVDANTEDVVYALIGVGLKSAYLAETVEILNISIQLQTSSSKCEWLLLFNPTIAGTFTYAGELRSAIEVARGATANTVTDGIRLGGGHIESTGQATGGAGSITSEIQNALKLGSTIAGASDKIVLCLRPIAGSTNVDAEASITWRELN